MILVTLRRGLNRQDARHAKIAPLTYWLWLYVSVTGVIVYLMVYRLYPHSPIAQAPAARVVAASSASIPAR